MTNSKKTRWLLLLLLMACNPQLYAQYQFGNRYTGLFRNDGKPTIVAHRGYWRKAGVAQNSTAAILEAEQKSDADMIELDLRSTKDLEPICFHDDSPQKILFQTSTSFPGKSVYDLNWDQIRNFFLYDRFGNATTEKLANLDVMFAFYASKGCKKPINLDIGIPEKVMQDGKLVDGQPFYDAVFLKAIELAGKHKILDRVIFKGKYTYDSDIWTKAVVILDKFRLNSGVPPVTMAYTPKMGDDIGASQSDPAAYRKKYMHDWFEQNLIKFISRPQIVVVGAEIRRKTREVSFINTEMGDYMTLVKQKQFAPGTAGRMRVGIFSETPTTCQGYWTKSAAERYINFDEEKRNNFDWLLNLGYDYIITDLPNILNQLRTARAQ